MVGCFQGTNMAEEKAETKLHSLYQSSKGTVPKTKEPGARYGTQSHVFTTDSVL